mmetsp:Transcript_89356/g.239446  ORF Transcript_89356/g.239446 Transcript_89356/m.239446 type:complete len:448 (-) Transcript_89356:135-1478(-)
MRASVAVAEHHVPGHRGVPGLRRHDLTHDHSSVLPCAEVEGALDVHEGVVVGVRPHPPVQVLWTTDNVPQRSAQELHGVLTGFIPKILEGQPVVLQVLTHQDSKLVARQLNIVPQARKYEVLDAILSRFFVGFHHHGSVHGAGVPDADPIPDENLVRGKAEAISSCQIPQLVQVRVHIDASDVLRQSQERSPTDLLPVGYSGSIVSGLRIRRRDCLKKPPFHPGSLRNSSAQGRIRIASPHPRLHPRRLPNLQLLVTLREQNRLHAPHVILLEDGPADVWGPHPGLAEALQADVVDETMLPQVAKDRPQPQLLPLLDVTQAELEPVPVVVPRTKHLVSGLKPGGLDVLEVFDSGLDHSNSDPPGGDILSGDGPTVLDASNSEATGGYAAELGNLGQGLQGVDAFFVEDEGQQITVVASLLVGFSNGRRQLHDLPAGANLADNKVLRH